MRMKLIAVAVLMLGVAAWAQPVYETKTASGTTTSVCYFATSPFQQARVVQAIATSDLATSVLTFKSGTTPMTCAYTNPVDVNFGVAATNGFFVGDFVIVETAAGAITNAQITGFTKATNMIFKDKIMATVPGDMVYRLGAATTLPVGAATKVYSGEAIFVGNRGRPIMVKVDGTSACSLDAISARYE